MGIIHARKQYEPCVISDTDGVTPCIPCLTKEDKCPGNPGSFEEIHKKVWDLYPQNFEGARLIVKKVLSKHFNVAHTITLSSITPSGYKFGAEYVGTKFVGPSEFYPMAKGDIMPNGNMNGSFTHTLGCRLRFKISTQIDSKRCNCNSTLEYLSDDFTLALTLANPKPYGVYGLQFLQSVTPRLALGAEIAYSRGSKIMSLAFRHNTGPTTLSALLRINGLHVSYYRKASKELQLGVEMQINLRNEPITSIVYQLDVPHADLTFRGIVNSECSVGAVFEKRLSSQLSTLIISAFLNHRGELFRVGVGLNVG